VRVAAATPAGAAARDDLYAWPEPLALTRRSPDSASAGPLAVEIGD
jgi:hypothetical protein